MRISETVFDTDICGEKHFANSTKIIHTFMEKNNIPIRGLMNASTINITYENVGKLLHCNNPVILFASLKTWTTLPEGGRYWSGISIEWIKYYYENIEEIRKCIEDDNKHVMLIVNAGSKKFRPSYY